MRQTIITLEKPVNWFGKLIHEIAVKEPTARQFLEIGEPQLFARASSGAIFAIEQNDAILRYFDLCVGVENASSFIGILPLSEGQKIKDALLAFFTRPAGGPETSPENGASSSSI